MANDGTIRKLGVAAILTTAVTAGFAYGDTDDDYIRLTLSTGAGALEVSGNGGSKSDVGAEFRLAGAWEFGNGWGAELGYVRNSSISFFISWLPGLDVSIDGHNYLYIAPTYTWNNEHVYVRGKGGLASWRVDYNVTASDIDFSDTGLEEKGTDLFGEVEAGVLLGRVELGLYYHLVPGDDLDSSGTGVSLGFRF